MQVAIIAVSIVLAVYLGVAAVLNIFYLEEARKNGQRLGLSPALSRFIGWCQLAAVIGLIAGLVWPPLAIAAATGLLLMMIGAVIAHRRVGDPILMTLPAVVVFCLTAMVFAGQIAVPVA
jgi:DoxX-like protein